MNSSASISPSIDLADRTVRVLGKGSKTRIVPVGRKAFEAIRAWLRERGALAGIDETALFVGKNGARLKSRAVQLRIAYWARRKGLPSARLSAPVPAFIRHASA